jgi:hypothetical protein
VLNAGSFPELTLVTCYPFYYVGSAPDRFVVKARLVTEPSKTQPPPIQPVISKKPPARIKHRPTRRALALVARRRA